MAAARWRRSPRRTRSRCSTSMRCLRHCWMRNWPRWPATCRRRRSRPACSAVPPTCACWRPGSTACAGSNPALALVVDPVLALEHRRFVCRRGTAAGLSHRAAAARHPGDAQPRRGRRIAGHCRAAGSRRRGAGREGPARNGLPGGRHHRRRFERRLQRGLREHAARQRLAEPAARCDAATTTARAASSPPARQRRWPAASSPSKPLVLAKMATTHALRHGWAAGAGAGPVRPRGGFALHAENLPGFSIPGQDARCAFRAAGGPGAGPVRDRRQRGLGAPGARCRRAHSAAAHQGPEPSRSAPGNPRKRGRGPRRAAPSCSSTTTGRWPSRKALTACTWDRKTSQRPTWQPLHTPDCAWA